MRFLLHPRRTAIFPASKVSKKRVPESYVVVASRADATSKKGAAALPSNCDSNDVSNGRTLTNRLAQQEGNRPVTHAWGQQCSPTCGCVVRFEANFDSDTQQILSASYQAKSLVTTFKKGESHHKEELRAVLTAKGRPMLRKCDCDTVHHLSAAVVEHMVSQQPSFATNTRPKLASSLEFNSLRSSLSFCQTALRSQGLPEIDTQCFDVVEEAFTALVKGRIPKPRKKDDGTLRRILTADDDGGDYDYEDEYMPTPPGQSRQVRRAWSQYDDDDDDSAFGTFLWKHHDYRIVRTGSQNKSSNNRISDSDDISQSQPRPMSTLRMFDDHVAEDERRQLLEQQLLDGSASGGETVATRTIPADWVSYVDELYYKQQLGIRNTEESA